MLNEWAAALAFFTRLPIPGVEWSFDTRRLAAWFPAVGAVVGALVGLVFWLAIQAGLPPLAAAWVAVVVEMLVTGALHPDGLADVADGMGGTTPERRLEIMKDSRLGSYGGTALMLTLIGRVVLLAAIPADGALLALVLAHAAARWAPVWALSRYPYARKTGTGAAFVGAGLRELALATVIALAVAWFAGGLLGIGAAVVAALAGAAFAAYVTRRLGGITGDVCGAVIEVALLAALLVLVAAGKG